MNDICSSLNQSIKEMQSGLSLGTPSYTWLRQHSLPSTCHLLITLQTQPVQAWGIIRNRRKNWSVKVDLFALRIGITRTFGLKTSLWFFELEVDLKCCGKVLSEFSLHLRLIKDSISKYHWWPYFLQGSEGIIFPP